MTSVDDLFDGQQVLVILRNMPVNMAVEMACRAWDLGIDLVEVPIQTPDYLASLEGVVRAGADRGRIVGAGTVIDSDQLAAARAAGAGFAVAPGLDLRLAIESESQGLPFIPGVATPTEVQTAVCAGFTRLKAFPAGILGTGWFKAMKGPFPNVEFIATGGINTSNAGDFILAGAATVALGSALQDPDQLDAITSLVRV